MPMTDMPPQTPSDELVARTCALLDAPDRAHETALAQAIETALEQGDNAALGHAVLSAAERGRVGLAERLASRLITHSSRWTLPGGRSSTSSLAAMAIPLLVRTDTTPNFANTARITALADSFVPAGLCREGTRIMLLPYLYSLAEMRNIGFCRIEDIAFSLAAREDGLLPPRNDFADYAMTGGETPVLAGGWRLHWIVGVVVCNGTPPPPWLLAVSDPEVDFSRAADRALLDQLAPVLRAWQKTGRELGLFGQDVHYTLGLPVLLAAAMPRIALSTALLQLDRQIDALDASAWGTALSAISCGPHQTIDPMTGDAVSIDLLSIALHGPLGAVASAECMLSAFLSAGAIDALYGCLLSGRGQAALYARTRRCSLDSQVAPLGSLLN